MGTKPSSAHEMFEADQSLSSFMDQMRKFDKLFCDVMIEQSDYTLVLEVRGDCGKLLHSRVKVDIFERPKKKKG
ncbi:hypothetical protein KAR91_77380 [Candidatus Pacearchaeota archaeon]|nr:hypothetical protein [Candidatus Pacearchaeota archaeon]